MSLFLAILALGALIVLHELGHYMVARWAGMRIHEFSVGFGPRVWYFKKGETEYSFRIIVLGGYVRVAGMHPSEEDADDERGFLKSSPGKRAAMIFAGPLANYITAAFIFIVIFSFWGIQDKAVHVGKVQQGTLLAKAGLQAGDRIISLNGKPIKLPSFTSSLPVQFSTALSKRTKKPISLSILRDGKQYNLPLPKVKKKGEMLGITFNYGDRVRVGDVKPVSVAQKMGFLKGDLMISLNGKSLLNMVELRLAIAKRGEEKTELRVFRKGKVVSIVFPEKKAVKGKKKAKEAKKTKQTDDIGITWDVKQDITIMKMKEGSVAQAAGLQKGDRVIGADGKLFKADKKTTSLLAVQKQLGLCETGKPVKLLVGRKGKEKEKRMELLLARGAKGTCGAGLAINPFAWILVMQVVPKSTAAAIGLKVGDRLLSIDGTPLISQYHLIRSLRHRTYRPIELVYQRKGKVHTIKVPMANIKGGKIDFKLGFQPQLDFPREYIGALGILKKAAVDTWKWNVRIWDGIVSMIRRERQTNLTGPVGIVRMAQTSMEQGLQYFLFFVAIISIHLAFFNLLPIPALDGGRLVFLVVQQVLRVIGGKEEWAIKSEMVANVVGFLLLFGLLIFVTFKDILKLIFS